MQFSPTIIKPPKSKSSELVNTFYDGKKSSSLPSSFQPAFINEVTDKSGVYYPRFVPIYSINTEPYDKFSFLVQNLFPLKIPSSLKDGGQVSEETTVEQATGMPALNPDFIPLFEQAGPKKANDFFELICSFVRAYTNLLNQQFVNSKYQKLKISSNVHTKGHGNVHVQFQIFSLARGGSVKPEPLGKTKLDLKSVEENFSKRIAVVNFRFRPYLSHSSVNTSLNYYFSATNIETTYLNKGNKLEGAAQVKLGNEKIGKPSIAALSYIFKDKDGKNSVYQMEFTEVLKILTDGFSPYPTSFDIHPQADKFVDDAVDGTRLTDISWTESKTVEILYGYLEMLWAYMTFSLKLVNLPYVGFALDYAENKDKFSKYSKTFIEMIQELANYEKLINSAVDVANIAVTEKRFISEFLSYKLFVTRGENFTQWDDKSQIGIKTSTPQVKPVVPEIAVSETIEAPKVDHYRVSPILIADTPTGKRVLMVQYQTTDDYEWNFSSYVGNTEYLEDYIREKILSQDFESLMLSETIEKNQVKPLGEFMEPFEELANDIFKANFGATTAKYSKNTNIVISQFDENSKSVDIYPIFHLEKNDLSKAPSKLPSGTSLHKSIKNGKAIGYAWVDVIQLANGSWQPNVSTKLSGLGQYLQSPSSDLVQKQRNVFKILTDVFTLQKGASKAGSIPLHIQPLLGDLNLKMLKKGEGLQLASKSYQNTAELKKVLKENQILSGLSFADRLNVKGPRKNPRNSSLYIRNKFALHGISTRRRNPANITVDSFYDEIDIYRPCIQRMFNTQNPSRKMLMRGAVLHAVGLPLTQLQSTKGFRQNPSFQVNLSPEEENVVVGISDELIKAFNQGGGTVYAPSPKSSYYNTAQITPEFRKEFQLDPNISDFEYMKRFKFLHNQIYNAIKARKSTGGKAEPEFKGYTQWMRWLPIARSLGMWKPIVDPDERPVYRTIYGGYKTILKNGLSFSLSDQSLLQAAVVQQLSEKNPIITKKHKKDKLLTKTGFGPDIAEKYIAPWLNSQHMADTAYFRQSIFEPYRNYASITQSEKSMSMWHNDPVNLPLRLKDRKILRDKLKGLLSLYDSNLIQQLYNDNFFQKEADYMLLANKMQEMFIELISSGKIDASVLGVSPDQMTWLSNTPNSFLYALASNPWANSEGFWLNYQPYKYKNYMIDGWTNAQSVEFGSGNRIRIRANTKDPRFVMKPQSDFLQGTSFQSEEEIIFVSTDGSGLDVQVTNLLGGFVGDQIWTTNQGGDVTYSRFQEFLYGLARLPVPIGGKRISATSSGEKLFFGDLINQI